LFLLSGVAALCVTRDTSQPALAELSPRKQAEELLRVARAIGDRRREALALADLGAAHTRCGEVQPALAALHEALTIARELQDQSYAQARALGCT
jgi:hypothetical protein